MITTQPPASEDQLPAVELKGRQIVDLPLAPRPDMEHIRHFGVALDNDEAQDFIAKGYRVYGDDQGPFLVIRLKSYQPWPLVFDKENVDVTFRPRHWALDTPGGQHHHGIICWMEEVI